MMTRASNSKTTPKFPGMRLQKDPPKSVVCCLFPFLWCPNHQHFSCQDSEWTRWRSPSKEAETCILYPDGVFESLPVLCFRNSLCTHLHVLICFHSVCFVAVLISGAQDSQNFAFFSARGAAKVAGKPVGLLWCAGIFREPLPLPSLEKMMGEWFRSRRERIVLMAASSFCSVWQRPHCSAATCRVVCPFPSCSSHSSPISQSMGKLPIFRLSSLLERHRTSSSKVLKTWVD